MTEQNDGPSLLVYAVDDDEGMRGALKRVFRAAGFGFEAFDSAQVLLERGDFSKPDVLLLDIAMPGISGLELLSILIERDVRVPVVFLTGTHSVAMAVTAMQRGAADFLEKPFDNEQLVARVRRAAQHRPQVDMRARRATGLGHFQSLTPREQQVMGLIVAGKSNKETAQALGVSPRTVEVHRKRVMDKMHADSLADLVTLAIAIGVE